MRCVVSLSICFSGNPMIYLILTMSNTHTWYIYTKLHLLYNCITVMPFNIQPPPPTPIKQKYPPLPSSQLLCSYHSISGHYTYSRLAGRQAGTCKRTPAFAVTTVHVCWQHWNIAVGTRDLCVFCVCVCVCVCVCECVCVCVCVCMWLCVCVCVYVCFVCVYVCGVCLCVCSVFVWGVYVWVCVCGMCVCVCLQINQTMKCLACVINCTLPVL
jgi:hypothetical protein